MGHFYLLVSTAEFYMGLHVSSKRGELLFEFCQNFQIMKNWPQIKHGSQCNPHVLGKRAHPATSTVSISIINT